MKQIMEMTKTLSQSESSKKECEPTKKLDRKWIDLLWVRMNGIYGYRWRQQFPTEDEMAVAKTEWQIGLAGMSAEQMQRALDWCRANSAWPPSIATMLAAGGAAPDTWEHKSEAYRTTDRSRLLTRKRTGVQRETAKQYIGTMRQILRGETNDEKNA